MYTLTSNQHFLAQSARRGFVTGKAGPEHGTHAHSHSHPHPHLHPIHTHIHTHPHPTPGTTTPPPPHPPLHLPHAAAFPPFKTLSPLPFRRERVGSRPSSLPSSPPSRHRLQPSAKCVLLTADCWGGCGGWFAGAADGRTGRRTDAGPTGPGPGPDPTPDRSILRE